MTIIPTIWKSVVTHTGLKILFSSLIKLVTLKLHEVTIPSRKQSEYISGEISISEKQKLYSVKTR